MFLTLASLIMLGMTVYWQRRRKKTQMLEKSLNYLVSKSQVNLQEVSMILRQMQSCRENGNTRYLDAALHRAFEHVHTRVAELLIRSGADVNCEDLFKQSPLCIALLNDEDESIGMVKMLLENGANINRRNFNGQTDFMLLFESGILTLKDILNMLDDVIDINERDILSGGSFLHLVSKRPKDPNKPDMIRALIKRGLNVNDIDNNDDTPLHLLASVACVESLECLLDNGADIAAKNRRGQTALHYLASSCELAEFEETLEFLTKRGANVNEIDNEGCSVIHHALSSKEATCWSIKTFRKHGVRMSVRDKSGRNEIYHAVEYIRQSAGYSEEDVDKRMEIIEYLIELGVDINEGDYFGVTALHLAVRRNCLTLLVGLLDLGSDITTSTQTGAIPLHWSCSNYNMAHVMIHWHLQNDVDINNSDNACSTALHWAVWFRNEDAIQTLLQAGADVTLMDINGNSARELSKKIHYGKSDYIFENYKRMEELMLESGDILKCNDLDRMFACPILRSIRKEDGRLMVKEHFEHLDLHRASVCALKDTVLSRQNMGLYFDMKENKEVPHMFKEFVIEIGKKVAAREPLFACDIQLAGSTYEGTKVYLPDEFDYIWYLTEFEQAYNALKSEEDPHGYLKLCLKHEYTGSAFAKYANIDGYLDCRLIIKEFYKYVNEEVAKLLRHSKGTQYEGILCQKFLNEIACSLSSLELCYFGRQAKLFIVSVDVVPAIRIRNTVNDMPTEKTLVKHFLPANTRLAVVFKTPDRVGVRDFSLHYRLSFAYLEQTIIKAIPFEIKQGYILLKSLVQSLYLPHVIRDDGASVRQPITSYRLKTCFLHALEEAVTDDSLALSYSRENDSSEKEFAIPLKWSKRIIEKFEKYLEERKLPTFFDHRKNLLSLEGTSEGVVEEGTCRDLLTLLRRFVEIFD